MVVTGNENGLIQFWDPTTGTNWDLIQSIQGGNQIDFICVSPDQMKVFFFSFFVFVLFS